MRRTPLALLTVTAALLLSLTGCTDDGTSGGSSTSPSPTGATEETVTINEDTPWALGGTLTIPAGARPPYPSVVLVQGSGPSDRDETVYGNKPFKDIAEHLTSQGIAVLRFDKRTYTYSRQIAADITSITVEEETIQDAVAAADRLRADPRMDPDRVFLLGHSLGGMLAPRIDAEGGSFAGLVIMAGSPRSLSEIIVDQTTDAVAALPPEQKALGQAQLDGLVAQLDALRTMSDDDAKQVVIGGASGYYFTEMDQHPAADYLAGSTTPLLILQGDKDFQVSPTADFGAYQTMLADRPDVTFKLYPGLNHLFMTSTTGTVDEYKTPSHVDTTVLHDIASWILGG
ncbi:MAG: lysophospholipase [Micrococcales bacterium]|nr:lysophospholipase [Micrococcales bacterium]